MATCPIISESCSVQNNRFFQNGQPIFTYGGDSALGFLEAIYSNFNINYPKFYKMDNLSKLGFLSTEVLLKDKNLADKFSPEEIGVILSNSNSSLDVDMKYYQTVSGIASPSLFVYTLPNIVIGEICIRNKIKGENLFFISKQFDADHYSAYVNNLFDTGILRACICGWVEFLEKEYSAFLMLVVDGTEADGVKLTTKNIIQLYAERNG